MDTAAVSVAVIKQQIETKSAEEALEILRSSLAAQLAQTLQLKTDAIQFDKPLIQLGVDSLMAVEVSSQIYKDFGHKVSVLKILSGLSADESKLFVQQCLHSLTFTPVALQVLAN
jgi:hybrid polyketide synthase/nonribosomal peptide synthetase ACE1